MSWEIYKKCRLSYDRDKIEGIVLPIRSFYVLDLVIFLFSDNLIMRRPVFV